MRNKGTTNYAKFRISAVKFEHKMVDNIIISKQLKSAPCIYASICSDQYQYLPLTAIMDLFNREIIGHSFSKRMLP